MHTMGLGNIVDELHDEHGLAHTGTTKEPNLASALVGGQQVHHLHACTAWVSITESCLCMQRLLAPYKMPISQLAVGVQGPCIESA